MIFRWGAAPYHTLKAYQVCDYEGHRLVAKRSISGGFTGKIDGWFVCNAGDMETAKAKLEALVVQPDTLRKFVGAK